MSITASPLMTGAEALDQVHLGEILVCSAIVLAVLAGIGILIKWEKLEKYVAYVAVSILVGFLLTQIPAVFLGTNIFSIAHFVWWGVGTALFLGLLLYQDRVKREPS